MQPLRQPAADAQARLSARERVGRDPSGCQFDTRRALRRACQEAGKL